MASKRVSTRKYDMQRHPELLEAIKTGKYSVRNASGSKFKQEVTWTKWRLIYDESNEQIRDHFYCSSCSKIYNLSLATSGRCLKTHALECVGPLDDDNRIDNRIDKHFTQMKKQGRKMTADDKLAIKEAALKFVIIDLRPISAINGDGLAELISTMTYMGAKYGGMTVADVKDVIPSRQTVRAHFCFCISIYSCIRISQVTRNICAKAIDVRSQMKSVLSAVFRQFGGAIAIDNWMDSEKKNNLFWINRPLYNSGGWRAVFE